MSKRLQPRQPRPAARALHDRSHELERLLALRDTELRELREHDAHFRLLADGAGDLVYRYRLTSPAGFEYVSPACQQVLGYTPEEIKEDREIAARLIHPDDQPLLEAIRRDRERFTAPHVLRYLAKDGRIVWIEQRRFPIYDAQGSLAGIAGIARDVTERKQAEDALRESEARFRLLAENAHDMIFRFRLLPNRAVEYCSPAAKRITGYSPEEFIQDPDLMRSIIHPEDQAKVAAFATAPRQDNERLTVRIIRKDGSIGWIESTRVPITDAAGRDVAVQTVVRDVTERCQAEEALQESEKRFRTLAEHAQDMIYRYRLAEPRGFEYVSPAFEKITGYPVERFLKDPALSARLVHPEETHIRERIRLEPESLTGRFITRWVAASGRTIWVEHNRVVFRDSQGVPVAVQGVVRDVTERVQAEEALRQSEERFRILAENAQDLIYVIRLDPERRYEYMSPAVQAILGRSPQEFLNDQSLFIKLVHPDDRHRQKALSKTLFDNGHLITEFRVVHATGRTVWLEARAILVRDHTGKPVAIHGVARDVTERKQAEDALRHSEERFRLLAENARDVVYRFRVTPRPGYEYLSPAATELYGYTPEEFYAVPSLAFKVIHPEDRRAFVDARKPWDTTTNILTARIVRKDGAVRWTEVHRTPIYDTQGKLLAIQGITRDITQRVEAAAALQRQVKLTQQVLDSSPDGIAVVSHDLRIVLANKAFQDQFPAQAGGSPPHHLTEVLPDNAIVESAQKALASKQALGPVEGILQAAEGERVLEARIIPMAAPDAAGPAAPQTRQVLLIVRDVTLQRAAQQRLYHVGTLASIGEMAAGVAHELNNPLTSVLGYAELALKHPVPPDLQRDIGIIQENARRASSVVRNLLAFARPTTPQKSWADINQVITKTLELRRYEMDVNNIQAHLDLEPGLPLIYADLGQMQQVILNIVINAEQAMAEASGHGTLAIATRRAGEAIRITFTDDGPGISPEHLRRLFNPFFTTKAPGKGTGLGLSICHTVVTEHGGKIQAESQPGKGATFLIELPISEPAREKDPTLAAR